MDLGLEGKTALVCAASHGLGFAIAQAFASEGAKVVVTSRSADALQDAAQQITQITGNREVHPVVADLTDKAAIETLFRKLKDWAGGADILINNIGGPRPGNFEELTDEDWETAFQQLLMSAIRCTRLALPYMKQNQWGRIVNVASSSIKQPVENLLLSNTLRVGVMALAKNLALEFAKDNILVNTLGPGRIATERIMQLDTDTSKRTGESIQEIRNRMIAQIPMGRYGQPDEFAAMAVFLGSSANGFITGQSILVDGGIAKGL